MARNDFPPILQVEKWDTAVISTREFWYFDKYTNIMKHTGIDTAQTASIIANSRDDQQQERRHVWSEQKPS